MNEFERMYRDISPQLRRYVRREERDEADDICSAVWEQTARLYPRFKGDAEGFRALVFVIARRRIIDHRRKRNRRRTDVTGHESFHGHAGHHETDIQALDQLSTRTMLEALIETLTPAQVEVIFLRVVSGLPVKEVAVLLGRSEDNVRIIHHRALKRLRAC